MENKQQHYSYFIVKPDGIKKLNDIISIIEKSGFENMKFFAIHDFENTIKKLYHTHYEKKGEKFAESFQSYLNGIKYIYNNLGLLIMVSDSKTSYEELTQKVFNIKQEVRNKFAPKDIAIATNDRNSKKTNQIKLLEDDGSIKAPRCLKESGYHRINDMNIIHCPDPSIVTTIEELNILYNLGIIQDSNMISQNMINNITKYKCGTFLNDMFETNYQYPITPNISGFIKCQIEFDEKKNKSER